MDTGRKIMVLRKYRKMTQSQLGKKLGFSASTATSRIAQYETGYRVPKEDVLRKICEILDVSPSNLIESPDHIVNLMESLFWIDPMDDESSLVPTMIMGTTSKSASSKTKNIIHTEDYSEKSGPHACIQIFEPEAEACLLEWTKIYRAMEEGKISMAEYLNWKFNWPASSKLNIFLTTTSDHENTYLED